MRPSTQACFQSGTSGGARCARRCGRRLLSSAHERALRIWTRYGHHPHSHRLSGARSGLLLGRQRARDVASRAGAAAALLPHHGFRSSPHAARRPAAFCCAQKRKETIMAATLRPSIRYGQNFLTNPALVDRLLDASSIAPGDLVLEIGAGEGMITERLARRCRRVIAFEIDPALARHLARRFAACRNVEVRAGDALALPLPAEPYKVFASIPFNRTAAIVRALTDAPVPPEDQYLVVQREAAERFSGRPATTLPAVLLHPWFEIGITHRFQRTDFTPVPGVDVVLLRLAKRGPPLVAGARMALYRDFVTAVFTAWQPTVADALRRLGGAAWAERVAATAEVAVCAPPSRLPPADWLSLFEAFARLADVRAQHRVTGAW